MKTSFNPHWRQLEERKQGDGKLTYKDHLITALLVFLLALSLLFTAGFYSCALGWSQFMTAGAKDAGEASFLAGFGKRIPLDVESDYVDGTLSNFPVVVHVSAASGIGDVDVSPVFDELTDDANRKKIAVTTSDGTTQCYVEIERWDDANEQAWLHVKIPSVASGTDTRLYLYYDAGADDNTDYVGDPTDTPSKSVWDANFKGVYHLGEDPAGSPSCADCMKDSTSLGNHLTSTGTMTSGDSIDCMVGKCVDLDQSNDYLYRAVDADFDFTGNYTLEAVYQYHLTAVLEVIVSRYDDGTNPGFGLLYDANEKLNSYHYTGAVFYQQTSSSTGSAFVYGASKFNTSTGSNLRLNASEEDTDAGTANIPGFTQLLGVGVQNHATLRLFKGGIDEVRLSNTNRSDAWLKATYYSLTDGLITFGTEETP